MIISGLIGFILYWNLFLESSTIHVLTIFVVSLLYSNTNDIEGWERNTCAPPPSDDPLVESIASKYLNDGKKHNKTARK